MAINWKEYELVLTENSYKVCEVTGDTLGGPETFTCKISDLLKYNRPKWIPEGDYNSYGGYQAYHFDFKGVDDEGVHDVVPFVFGMLKDIPIVDLAGVKEFVVS